MAETDRNEATSAKRDPFGLCGTTIGDKYAVKHVVGKGGFGVVYRGVHEGFEEAIAIKCLRIAAELTHDERNTLMTRLQEEGRVLHRLSKLTSGIVQALDVGSMTTAKGDWVPYLVLEWLEGQTLGSFLSQQEHGKELASAIKMLEPAARALEIAHKQKVAHRDVKPENLYLTKVGGALTLKVLDFGIAKVLTDSHFTAAPAATKKQPSAFTPSYGAPEQFNKKRGATGPWTDVFALALILVELVSGERALDGDDATQLYIAAADPSARPTLREHGVEVSDAVEDVLRRALAIDPHDRYQNAGAFWDALERAARGETLVESTRSSDVSETGEFITRHEMDVPAAVSGTDDPTTLALARPDRPKAGKARAQPQRAKTGKNDSTKKSAAALHDESNRNRRKAPGAGGSGAKGSGAGGPATGGSRTREFGLTTGAPAASGRWMPVVGLLAIAGAIAVFYQWRKLTANPVTPELTAEDSTGRPLPSPLPPPSSVTSAVPSATRTIIAPAPSAIIDAGSVGGRGAGGAGGATGAGGAREAGSEPFAPPAGMIYVNSDAGRAVIDKTEVTAGQYAECHTAGRCVNADRVVVRTGALTALGIARSTTPEQLAESWVPRCNAVRGKDDHPVNCVSHGQATEYCHFRNKRLPTLAEWSLVTGANARRFPWGNEQPECSTACFDLDGACLNTVREVATCAVGARSGDTSPDGILDLGANVAEWLADEGQSPTSAKPAWRIVAGGSFLDAPAKIEGTHAIAFPPTTTHVTIGFRCAVDPPAIADEGGGGRGGGRGGP